ncbi:MAG TPA: type II toxin-antitoxin system HipA family toxin [Myxococcota bacterium]|nr:type II toxin-antitoxin system HipA family toxin [Myxococcota bacterium]HPV04539.1 type II toxin-antitoxin system HipA family toxin [Myxococcota bacterium]
MMTIAEVRLWGTPIGAVSLDDSSPFASFQYMPAFLSSGIQPAPLRMPLSAAVYRFPGLSTATFHGLPGMLADSLPDRFGNAVIDAWLTRNGRSPDSFNAVERLCYTGTRGMGALEYYPLVDLGTSGDSALQVDALVRLAAGILSSRQGFVGRLGGPDGDTVSAESMAQILRVGTSAGGARAKAVIAWNPETGEVRSGQADTAAGFQQWLMKFDGVSGNADRELADPAGYGLVEYAYWMMARAAGIVMSEARIYSENGRNHFMTRRFDRTGTGGKLHMQSLGAIGHHDYNAPGSCSYEQAFGVIRALGLGMDAIEQFFRRMVFNIVARNQDDHVKNVAFLMDRSGTWLLAPAFDVTWAYQPDGVWTGTHQMSMNGKRDGFVPEDFKACARTAGLVRGRGEEIVRDICKVVGNWPEYAATAGVPQEWAESIFRTFRFFRA